MNPTLEALARELDELGKASHPAQPDPVPDFTGTDWRLISAIGQGAMGRVYEAEQISLTRRVAIKVLPASVSSSPDRRTRFIREAKTLAMLHHPNIVKVYAAGMAGERLFYAMDLIRGKDLRNAAPQPPEEVARIGVAAARALAYAHRCGVVHQDVKPANLLLDQEGNLHLADFGIAALLEGGENASASGGTRRYMAPEMQAGHGVVSPASDQYSLGVTLGELACLPECRPGGGKSPRISPEFRAIIARMTARDPAARYPDMESAADDIQRYLRHEPVRACRTSILRRIRLWSRRNPSAAACALAAALGIVAFVAALAIGYARTNRALKAAEAARAETELALRQTEDEAARAAQSLVAAVVSFDRSEPDRREAELERALHAAEQLAARFPENRTISSAVGQLRYAHEAHSRIKFRRSGAGFPRRRRSE